MADAPVPERSFDDIAPKDKGKGKVSIEVTLKSFKPEDNATAFFTTDKIFKIEATVDAKVYSKLVPALKEEDIEMPPKIETSMTQHFPEDLEEKIKIKSFNEFMNDRREDDFADRMIIDIDELPVYSDHIPELTVDKKGLTKV